MFLSHINYNLIIYYEKTKQRSHKFKSYGQKSSKENPWRHDRALINGFLCNKLIWNHVQISTKIVFLICPNACPLFDVTFFLSFNELIFLKHVYRKLINTIRPIPIILFDKQKDYVQIETSKKS